MKTSATQLKWLIDFLNRDLSEELKTMKNLAWEKLQVEIIRFASLDADELIHVELVSENPYRVLTRELAVNFHRKARTSISVILEYKDAPEERLLRRIEGEFFFHVNPAHPKRLLILQIGFVDLLDLRVAESIILGGIHRIKTCPLCRGIFFGNIGKKKYCSKRCINRVTRQKWLSIPKNRRKESEWARKRYVQRKRRKD